MNKYPLFIILLVAFSAFCAEAFPATPVAPQKPTITRPPAVKPMAPAKQLTITDLTVNDTAAGAPGGQEVKFRVRVTVQEPGRCSIHDVEPIIFVKTADGKTEPVRVISARDVSCNQSYTDEQNFIMSGTCTLICDELRGGQATLEFTSDSDKPLSPLTQIGICFNYYATYPDRHQECTWYPLETVYYYRLKK